MKVFPEPMKSFEVNEHLQGIHKSTYKKRTESFQIAVKARIYSISHEGAIIALLSKTEEQ